MNRRTFLASLPILGVSAALAANLPHAETPAWFALQSAGEQSNSRYVASHSASDITITTWKYEAIRSEALPRPCDGIGCETYRDYDIVCLADRYTHVAADDSWEAILLDAAESARPAQRDRWLAGLHGARA